MHTSGGADAAARPLRRSSRRLPRVVMCRSAFVQPAPLGAPLLLGGGIGGPLRICLTRAGFGA